MVTINSTKIIRQSVSGLKLFFQEVPEKSKEGPGGPWKFCGLLPLFDPPRHDSAETIRKALDLGVCVKMITGKWKLFFFYLGFLLDL